MLTVLTRFCFAAMIYAMIFAVFGALHDYPQLREQIRKVRIHDPIAEKRQWLTFFYFINEAGSGLKFFLTGNERHLYSYPSATHLFAARKARALDGDWQAQMTMARMYYFGEFVGQNRRVSLQWLLEALGNAPDEEKAQATKRLIEEVGAEVEALADEGAADGAAEN